MIFYEIIMVSSQQSAVSSQQSAVSSQQSRNSAVLPCLKTEYFAAIKKRLFSVSAIRCRGQPLFVSVKPGLLEVKNMDNATDLMAFFRQYAPQRASKDNITRTTNALVRGGIATNERSYQHNE